MKLQRHIPVLLAVGVSGLLAVLAFRNIRPAEVARACLAARELQIHLATSLATIFVERVLDMGTLVFLFGMAAQRHPALIPASLSRMAFVAVAGLLAALALLAFADGRLRRIASDLIRIVTVRMPIPLLYGACFPLAALGTVPALRYLTFSVHPDFRVRLIENFDWLAPPYQYKHTKEEMRAWFESAGFSVLRQLAHGVVPKVGMLGQKRK